MDCRPMFARTARLRRVAGGTPAVPANPLTVSHYSALQVKILPARRSGLPARRFELQTDIVSSPQRFPMQ
jgi:hypothetical protein